jgi:hypothetical protein
MNDSTQKRQIQRFLRGQDKRDIDAFSIYQWIERCHIQGWWGLGIALASNLPPNSLDQNYQKRLEFLLNECRKNVDAEQESQKMLAKTNKEFDKNKVLSNSKDINYSFPTHYKEISPIHFINHLVHEEKIQYFDEIAQRLCIKFHDGNLRKSKRLLYNHARHRGIQLK